MIRRSLIALFLACLAVTASAGDDALPEIFQPDPGDIGSFIDLSLRIESLQCGIDGSCLVRARGTYHGRVVGLEVVVGAARNGRRGVAYRSIGEESDAFLLVLSELYRQKAPSLKFISEVYAEAVSLKGSLSTLQTEPMKIKVFFNANGPESKYAELYTNIIPAERALQIFEKDQEYRENVLRAFAK